MAAREELYRVGIFLQMILNSILICMTLALSIYICVKKRWGKGTFFLLLMILVLTGIMLTESPMSFLVSGVLEESAELVRASACDSMVAYAG